MRELVRRFWASGLWGVVVYPIYWAGRPLIAVGPWLAIALVDDPPLWIAAIAALAGVGWMAHIFVQGFYARFLAIGSAAPLLGALASRSWALTIRNLVRIAWLVPLVGLWSAGLEHHLHAGRTAPTTTYTALAVWQIADAVPIVDLPSVLGQPNPPVVEWGAGTGVAIFLLDITVIWALFLVISELITSRSQVLNRGLADTFVDIDAFNAGTERLVRGGAKRRSLLLRTVFLPVLLVGTVPFRSTPVSSHSKGMAFVGGLTRLSMIGAVVAIAARQWGLAGVAVYWAVGAWMLEKEFQNRGYMQ